MNICLKLIILLLCAKSFGQSIASDKVVVLIDDYDKDWFRFSENETWQPSSEQIELTKDITKRVIEEHKTEYYAKPIAESFSDYYFQFFPIIDENGKRIIYVNSFCHIGYGEYWENHIVDFDDGGYCFWQVQIDPYEESYFDFQVNGM
jgi:hypothetical protein